MDVKREEQIVRQKIDHEIAQIAIVCQEVGNRTSVEDLRVIVGEIRSRCVNVDPLIADLDNLENADQTVNNIRKSGF